MVHSVYNTSPTTLNPHRLSYFLIVLAIGVCVDQRRSHQSWTADAERYHQLSRAALCETSVITEPSMDAINALVCLSGCAVCFVWLMMWPVLYGAVLVNVLGGQGGDGVRVVRSGVSQGCSSHSRRPTLNFTPFRALRSNLLSVYVAFRSRTNNACANRLSSPAWSE